MKYEEFIAEVRRRASLGSDGEAEAASQATLRTLAERLAGGEPHDLASQLPRELAEYARYEGEQKSDPFSLEEFYRRVAEREGVGVADASRHARVVMEVVREAVTAGELGDVRSQLPAEYGPLFGEGG
ncbi:hypothetical protein RxyAA322_30640 [Rubrobacter xylanophilus]|uniref:DUF2267 domain-containing protein n=1 Tax=Rubrobacter xylanophilus TaxID=49319 RepID=A0A510HMG4_9ACTN|nr:DUF2267 domain-containing protein [Rubrobacter xylanophilus]BBL81210.1 hypothetical protein RxyAA322_30640 [Rubrobacter xylanophilus]